MTNPETAKTGKPTNLAEAPLSKDTLASLAGWIKRYIGLSYPPRRRNELESLLMQAMTGFGFCDAKRFADWLLVSSPPDRTLIEVLARHLTIGETYFFREGAVYQILEEKILPEIIRERRRFDRRLRVWSAGCSSGEEAYTLAILIHRLIPDRKDWNLSILGTDINPISLQRAEKGEYGSWSLRECPAWVRERYFRPAGVNRYALLPEVRNMVAFSYLNLAWDTYPSLLSFTNAMDVIFCRNVLMYFEEDTVRAVIRNLENCLIPGGWLVLSPVEGVFIRSECLSARRFSKAILYKKELKIQEEKECPKTAQVYASSFQDSGTTICAERKSPPPRSGRLPEKKTRKAAPALAGPELPPRAGSPLEAARALSILGRYRDAIEALREPNGRHPEESAAQAILARCHANIGDLEEAMSCCDRALAADRLAAGLHYLRYTILQEKGAEEEARESLQRTLYLDPDFILGHFAMFVLNRRRGNRKEAERHRKITEMLLGRCGRNELLPDADGMTAGRLTDMLRYWPAV